MWDDHSPYNATFDPGTYVKVSSWLNKHLKLWVFGGVEGQTQHIQFDKEMLGFFVKFGGSSTKMVSYS